MVYDVGTRYRSSDYAIESSFALLKLLLGLGEAGMYDLSQAAKLTFRTTQKYISVLERLGLVEVIPTERRNIVRLTERGRCVARCLVSS